VGVSVGLYEFFSGAVYQSFVVGELL
jgi:hypothetical protein